MARHRHRNRFASEAALEALVRFGPELSGLRELQRQAIENYSTAIQQAHGTSRGIIGAVDRARPEVARVYDRAGLQQATSGNLLTSDIAALPGVANSIKGGAQLEATHAVGALRDARAAALTDLSSRRVSAKEGEAFAVNNAHRELVDALTKVLGRKQDLRRERGAFTALTTRQLRREATQEADKLSIAAGTRSQSERNSIRSSGIDPDTGRPIPGGKADPKAKAKRPKLNTNQQNTAIDNISAARDAYGQFSGQKGFHERGLRSGLKIGQLPGADNKPIRIPTVKSDIEIVAGFEIAKRGTLTRQTYLELIRRGYRVPKRWRPGHARVPDRPALAPGPGGQQRPN